MVSRQPRLDRALAFAAIAGVFAFARETRAADQESPYEDRTAPPEPAPPEPVPPAPPAITPPNANPPEPAPPEVVPPALPTPPEVAPPEVAPPEPAWPEPAPPKVEPTAPTPPELTPGSELPGPVQTEPPRAVPLAPSRPKALQRKAAPPSTERPRVVVDLGFGGAMYGEALGTDFGIGTAYRARVGLQLDPMLAIDLGTLTTRHEASPGESAIATTFDVSLRLSLPIPGIRPFITAGMGTGRVALRDDLAGVYRVAPHYAFEVPIGAGVEFQVAPALGLQVAANQAFIFAGGIGDPKPGRTQLMAVTIGARVYF